MKKSSNSKPPEQEKQHWWGKGVIYLGKNRECYFCKREMQNTDPTKGTYVTRDHFWPKSKGGTTLVKCCMRCNQLKLNRDPLDFMNEWAGRYAEMPEWPFEPPSTINR